MLDRMTLVNWIGSYMVGDFDSADVKTQIKAGWYDWFCKDSSLQKKTQRMGHIIVNLHAGGKVDFNNWYVWFKNNCPLNGPLYDDFRFARIDDGTVMFTIQLDCCWNKTRYAVYGRTPDGEFHSDEPLFETDSVHELIKWLNTPWEVK